MEPEMYKEKLNHLIVYANPNPQSLSASYRDALAELTEMSHNELNVRDLYKIGFHPVLEQEDFEKLKQGNIPPEIKVEQDYILWADLITFIYPIWWSGMPAILKGYIDRVFSREFAYTVDCENQLKGLLAGKKAVVLNNMGFTYEYYEKSGMLDAVRLTTDKGIFEFCAMEVVAHHFFGHLDNASKNEREGHVNALKYIYDKLLPGLFY